MRSLPEKGGEEGAERVVAQVSPTKLPFGDAANVLKLPSEVGIVTDPPVLEMPDAMVVVASPGSAFLLLLPSQFNRIL